MLVKSEIILKKAKKEKRAVGAFNFTTLEQLKAIANACKSQNMGCILATSESAIKYMGIKNIVSMVKNEVEDLDLEFSLHLDHGKTFEICKLCIDNGYNSVMIDASSLPLEENIKLSKKVADYAKNFDVSVEAELGKIQGVEDNVSSVDSIFTDPNVAQDFINKTGINSLAISIGTSHGAYKFKGESKLDIERLIKIDTLTNHFPLVLHGASSVSTELVKNFENVGGKLFDAKGVSDSNLKDAIKNGICKINVDTDLRIAYTTGVRQSLQNSSNFNLRDYLTSGIDSMQKEVENRIKLFSNK